MSSGREASPNLAMHTFRAINSAGCTFISRLCRTHIAQLNEPTINLQLYTCLKQTRPQNSTVITVGCSYLCFVFFQLFPCFCAVLPVLQSSPLYPNEQSHFPVSVLQVPRGAAQVEIHIPARVGENDRKTKHAPVKRRKPN